jgi:hypothetical protein
MSISKSSTPYTQNASHAPQHDRVRSPRSMSRSKTSPLNQQIPPTIPVDPQNVQPKRTLRETGGGGPSSRPEARGTSRSPHAQGDPRREVHANQLHNQTEDRGRSVQPPAVSYHDSLPPLPPGASSVSSLQSSVAPAAVRTTSSGLRPTRGTPSSESRAQFGRSEESSVPSDANRGVAPTYGRSHANLSAAPKPNTVLERAAATAELPSLYQPPSPPPHTDRSTSHYLPPIQHRTVSSFSGTAAPNPSNHPGGITGHGDDCNAPRVNGTSESGETPKSPSDSAGSLIRAQPSPTAGLLSPHDHVIRAPSNSNLAVPSAGSGRPLPRTPPELQAEKSKETGGSSDERTMQGAGMRIPTSVILFGC